MQAIDIYFLVELFVSRIFEKVERLQALLSFKEGQEEHKYRRGGYREEGGDRKREGKYQRERVFGGKWEEKWNIR